MTDEQSKQQDSSGSSVWWWTFGSVPEVSPQQMKQLVSTSKENDTPLQIVDVRTESEFVQGHIEGAVNCSFLPNVFSFSSRMSELPLDKTRPVYTICLSAHRSIAAVKWLRERGFEAYQLQGGMKAWRKENLEEVVEKKEE